MKAETWVALGAAVVALLAIFLGPVATHLLTQRKDDRHWLRQQRSETYIEILGWMHEIARIVQTEDDTADEEIDQLKERSATLLARAVLMGSDTASAVLVEFIDVLIVWGDAALNARGGSVDELERLYEKFGDTVRAEVVRLAGRRW